MNELFNHLWQSTAFAAAVALAAFALRRNSPRLRYWLWLAASIKFLIPFSLLVSTGASVQFPPDTPSFRAVTVQQISTYFAPISQYSEPTRATVRWPLVLAAIWATGSLFLLARWFRSWRRMNVAAREGHTLEPGVFGLFRPVLLLPEGLADSLTEEQLQAVLAHEARHIECYDNLTAALHMCVETIFWFHPLVWWIGAQLMEERERDCDEAVLMQGSHPGDYARGIVQVCQNYIESPLPCASGISGSDLKKRIREIMTWRGSLPVSSRGRAALATAGFAAVAVPFLIGVISAQSQNAGQTEFEAASIKIVKPGTDIPPNIKTSATTLTIRSKNVIGLLMWAYQISAANEISGPDWALTQDFDITAKALAAVSTDQLRLMLQSLLRQRFQLAIHREQKVVPLYSLVVNKDGPRLHEVHDGPINGARIGWADKTLTCRMVNHVSELAAMLPQFLDGRPVQDKTGLAGVYDFTLNVEIDADQMKRMPQQGVAFTGFGYTSGIFDAVQKLGLKLEATKGPVSFLVIDHVEQPSGN